MRPVNASGRSSKLKTILCYGDSNTWGTNLQATIDPGTGKKSPNGGRLPHGSRWPNILAAGLGSGHHVIEEGLPGRMAHYDDPYEPCRNGMTYLLPCLLSHQPIDLFILMLGTNNFKARFGLLPSSVARCIQKMVIAVQRAELESPNPAVLVISPPLVNEERALKEFAGAGNKSLELGKDLAKVAKQTRVAFFDAKNVDPSPLDGCHLDADGHAKLGALLIPEVKRLLAIDRD
jgi:lysophospholipase L1-like esterase